MGIGTVDPRYTVATGAAGKFSISSISIKAEMLQKQWKQSKESTELPQLYDSILFVQKKSCLSSIACSFALLFELSDACHCYCFCILSCCKSNAKYALCISVSIWISQSLHSFIDDVRGCGAYHRIDESNICHYPHVCPACPSGSSTVCLSPLAMTYFSTVLMCSSFCSRVRHLRGAVMHKWQQSRNEPGEQCKTKSSMGRHLKP